MDSNIKVSIAIPFFNAEEYLADAIDSVIWQTYKNWELILLDDGSKDNSLKIAEHYQSKDFRIKVYSDGENKNLSYRLNQIPTLVENDYLLRMDADDIMHPEKIEKQMKVLSEHPEIDVLGTNAYSINEHSKVVGVRYREIDKDILLDVDSFIHPTIIAKTEWFRKNKYDDNALRIEDKELWCRTSDTSNFKMIAEPLFFYREVGQNYYKKYFKANEAKKYILKKYNNSKFWKIFFMQNIIKGTVYRFFRLFNREDILVLKRNQIIFKHKKNIESYLDENGKIFRKKY